MVPNQPNGPPMITRSTTIVVASAPTIGQHDDQNSQTSEKGAAGQDQGQQGNQGDGFLEIMASLERVRTALHTQTAAKSMKEVISPEVDKITQLMTKFAAAIIEERKSEAARSRNFEQAMQEIRAAVCSPAKTYAQAVSESQPAPTASAITASPKPQVAKAKARKERAKLELTLSSERASSQVKKEIREMHLKPLAERLHKAIESSDVEGEKPRINSINKLSNNQIRLQFTSEEAVKRLEKVNWNSAFEGLMQHKRKYGPVAHNIAKRDIDFSDNNDKETAIAQLQEENNYLPIVDIALLRRKPNSAPTHSIIVFASDAQAADQCIDVGIVINYERKEVDRYMPQLRITQCYNCYGYGHRASQCRCHRKCGKCGEEDHAINDCTKEQAKCMHCDGSHPAWHYECDVRKAVSRRLADHKIETSAWFTK